MSQIPHSAETDRISTVGSNLHVVHLIKGLGPGGAERLIVNQLETGDPAISYTVLRLIGEKFHLVDAVQRTGATSMLIGGGRFWPFALRKKLQGLDADVIHSHSPILAVAARLLVSLTRIDAIVITTEHNRWPRHHWLTRLMNRLTARLDDARIAVSDDVRSSMATSLHASTLVLDHGVPVAQLQTLQNKRGEMRARLLGDVAGLAPAQQPVVIGIVANFRPEKAYDVFLTAAEHALSIVADTTTTLRFFVVGQGPGETTFREDVAERMLGDNIEVLGYRDDATEVMSAFDIFTLASRHEGKPVSIMEAFALGIPVVATRAGGIPEAVHHGANGLLVDVGDFVGLAEAWVELATNVLRRDSLAQAAAASANDFDASVATKSIESLYRSTIG